MDLEIFINEHKDNLEYSFIALIFLFEISSPLRLKQKNFRRFFFNDLATRLTLFLLYPKIDQVVQFYIAPFARAALPHGLHEYFNTHWLFAVLIIIVFNDLIFYLLHRFLFHNVKGLWGLHKMHHSAKDLDWVVEGKISLYEVVIFMSIEPFIAAIVNYPPFASNMAFAFIIFHGLFIHADINLKFPGPFKYLIASPFYHRWHHAKNIKNKNFAALPFIDYIFGTYYHPVEACKDLGYEGEKEFPKFFLFQLIYPLDPQTIYRNFKRKKNE